MRMVVRVHQDSEVDWPFFVYLLADESFLQETHCLIRAICSQFIECLTLAVMLRFFMEVIQDQAGDYSTFW